MRRAGDLAEVAQKLDVRRLMAKTVIADQAAIRLPAELSELFFVNFLKQRTLIPGRRSGYWRRCR